VFDWQRFLDGHGISSTRDRRYSGPHRVSIQCPFCGDDTGFNLGIDVRSGFWHCWRESVAGSHSGRSPYRLIEQLLGCSRETARVIVTAGESILANDYTFASDIDRMLGRVTQVTAAAVTLEFPQGYRLIDSSLRAKRLYYPYIQSRGYTESQTDWLVKTFRLHYAVRGPFSYRVIFPVYYRNKLVTWTARAIDDNTLRYRTLSHNSETAAQTGTPLAVMSIKDTLYDFDRAHYGGGTLVITEGVFDSMRITCLGWPGIRAVALCGKQATPAQIDLLADLVPRYRRVVSLLDADTGLSGFAMFPEDFQVKQGVLPHGVKDPALLTRKQFSHVFPYGDNS